MVPPIFEEIRKKRPGAWILYGLYSPLWWGRQEDMHLLKDIPQDAVAVWYIWNSEKSLLKAKDSDINIPPPMPNNILLFDDVARSLHLGAFVGEPYRCFCPQLERIQAVAIRQHKMNTQGVGVCGGPSEAPGNEIDYIAHLEFSRNPELSIDEFSSKYIAFLYGQKAEPLVLQLMLRQPTVQVPWERIWKSWAALMCYGYFSDQSFRNKYKLCSAGEEDLRALREQIALAREAREVASPSGKTRLDKIIQVLEEYRIIGELSREESLQTLVKSNKNLPLKNVINAYEILKKSAADAGLSDEIYHYSRLK